MSGRSTPAGASCSPTAPRSRPARRPSPLRPPSVPYPLRLVPCRPRPPRLVASPPLRCLAASPPPPQIRSKSRYNRTCSTESCLRPRAMHDHGVPQTDITRRAVLRLTAAFVAALSAPAHAAPKAREKAKQVGRASFAQWVESFKPRALARGVSEATYARVMRDLKPDTSVYALDRSQPEFTETLWQYVNRRVSDWRITEGREKAKEYDALLKRIEQDFGVAPPVMLGIWGVESAYGDPYVQKNHMRPIFPALGALAWGEPRRRRYWEQELLNALVIVERVEQLLLPIAAPSWLAPGKR